MLTTRKGKLWFFEELYKDHAFGFEVSEILVPEYDTGFQKLMVVNTPRFGKVLILDNVVQFAESDEYIYHEAMAHTALFSHECPKNILIVGGGDLCIAREIMKHESVESITVIDIDGEVTYAAKEYFSALLGDTIRDPRLTILHIDASEIDTHFAAKSFDVILMDTTDNVGVAVPLFQGTFTQKVYDLLTENGILIRLGGSVLLQQQELQNVTEDTIRVFGEDYVLRIEFTATATYYGGPFALVIAGKGTKPTPKNRTQMFQTRWYSHEWHNTMCNK